MRGVRGGLASRDYCLVHRGPLLVREALGLLHRWVAKDLQPGVVFVVVQVDVFDLLVRVVVLRVPHLLPTIGLRL